MSFKSLISFSREQHHSIASTENYRRAFRRGDGQTRRPSAE
jgi:hypothetical protein